MFFRPGLDPHGLAHNPFKALIAPRPIGWISSLDADGRVNLAPYSFFNAVAEAPPMLAYANNGVKLGLGEGKDSLGNIRATGEFVANVVSFALRDAMNATSGPYPHGEDEFATAGLTPAASRLVAPPRVAEAPAALECRLWRIIDLPGENNHLVIGEVVGIHIDEAAVVDGKVDITLYRPVARLGYRDYAAVNETFSMHRPAPRSG
jgi:flavin reductase (DIM6/NTAB) family NADH-FMN oxidoreductase RutF